MIKVYSDGACSGNPGPAGIGFVIYNDSGEKISDYSEYIGHGTNNIAEYTAVLKAIREVKRKLKNLDEKIVFHLDSELAVRQLNGIYKIRDVNLKKLVESIKNELNGLDYEIVHVRREKNKEADRLSKSAISDI